MYKNYLVTALRNLRKQKLYALINLVSLSFGLAIALTALSYVVYEFTWEDCHENHDRIYRIEATYSHADTLTRHARMMAPLAPAIEAEIPGVVAVTGFRQDRRATVEVDRHKYPAGQLLVAGPDFFDVFTVPLESGDPTAFLRDPYSVLVSDSLAGLCFPDENPIGRLMTLNDTLECRIAGVMPNMSRHTQVHTDLILSYSTLASAGVDLTAWNDIGNDLTYLVLDTNADPAEVTARIENVARRHLPADLAERYSFRLKALDDIYFETYFSDTYGELYPGGEWEIIYMMAAIGLFILIQAIANFVNLSTARSSDRTKEVGVRKTFGAQRWHLMRQFLSESMLLTLIAAFLSLGFYEFFRYGLVRLLPGQGLSGIYERVDMALASLVLVAVVGIVAGYYPALYLSRFRPIAVLQGERRGKGKRALLRRGLVVFQFTLAIIFVTSTVIIYRQQSFVFDTDLGFDKENMLVLNLDNETAANDGRLLVNALAESKVGLGITRCSAKPGTRLGTWWLWRGPDREDTARFTGKVLRVDHSFLATFDLRVVEGRWFDADRPEDVDNAVLINEGMVRELGIAQPLGYRIYRDSTRFFEVVGVLKDFHGAALDYSFEPNVVVSLNPDRSRYLFVKLPGDDISGSIADVGDVWRRTLPDQEFAYTFLDEDIRSVYSEMEEMIGVFGVLAVVSIAIACLGIFGLVSYMALQRTKEIGIRKVLGASEGRIVTLLAREFLLLIVIANLIAWPLAYLFMYTFLSEFPFQVSLGVGTFASGGLLALALALVSSGFQALRAARANPVKALRYE